MKTGFLMTTTATLIIFTASAQAGNLGSPAGLSLDTSVQTSGNGDIGVNADTSARGGDTNMDNNMDNGGASSGSDSRVGTRASTPIPSNMTSDQFSTFTQGQWDTNADGTINSSEWNNASLWFGQDVDARTRSFATWDANSNGSLDRNELTNVFATSGLYQNFDVNGNGTIDSTEAARIPR